METTYRCGEHADCHREKVGEGVEECIHAPAVLAPDAAGAAQDAIPVFDKPQLKRDPLKLGQKAEGVDSCMKCPQGICFIQPPHTPGGTAYPSLQDAHNGPSYPLEHSAVV